MKIYEIVVSKWTRYSCHVTSMLSASVAISLSSLTSMLASRTRVWWSHGVTKSGRSPSGWDWIGYTDLETRAAVVRIGSVTGGLSHVTRISFQRAAVECCGVKH